MPIPMAKGAETDEFLLLSKVRTGLKREFAFALKSQHEIAGSLGRTRTRKPDNGAEEPPSSKRTKKPVPVSGNAENDVKLAFESEGDLKRDFVDAVSDDENKSPSVDSLKTGNNTELMVVATHRESNCVSDACNCNAVIPSSDVEELKDLPKTEDTGGGEVGKASGNSLIAKIVDKMSIKSLVKTAPRRLKDLLGTGLLDGLSIRYIRGVKHKVPKEIGLRGVISGSGVLCYCKDCKGVNEVTPSLFEIHAGSSNKRPPDYMYMDNGNTLRDVLDACKLCKPDDLETTIRNAIGLAAAAKCLFCINCKGSISVAGKGRNMLLCGACIENKAPEETSRKLSKACESPAKKLVRKSCNAKKHSAPLNKSQGRLTRKDLRLHKLVFEDDVLPDGTEVGYYVHGKLSLSGFKQGSGILCSCCQKEVSPSQFEAHAGWASRRKPYLHIFTSNGVSLHELSLSLSRTMRFSTVENDDLCSICCQPGYLVCCDGCPRSFHKECIPLLEPLEVTWYCRYCSDNFQKEKFAERNANAIAAGRVAGVDPIEQIISQRCIRFVRTDQESDGGGCALCRGHDFAKGGFSRRTVMLCDQCEREFHVGCLQDHGMQDLKELPEGKWFCSSACNRINSTLQQLIEGADQQVPDCLLNMIKQKYPVNSHDDVNLDIKWRLLSGKMSSVGNTRALLSKAVSVFHEQFDPIPLPHSKQDMIPPMVYGRNVKDMEFGGMYCAVLTVNSVIVSVGVFRVLGKDIAELPLVATASGHKKMGYFQALYSCIERLLRELDVEHLWLPAANEAKPLWTNKFGFSEYPRDEFTEIKKRFALMTFDGTCALRKPIGKLSMGDAIKVVDSAFVCEKSKEADALHASLGDGNTVSVSTNATEVEVAISKGENVTQVEAMQEDGEQCGGENPMEVVNEDAVETEISAFKEDKVQAAAEFEMEVQKGDTMGA